MDRRVDHGRTAVAVQAGIAVSREGADRSIAENLADPVVPGIRDEEMAVRGIPPLPLVDSARRRWLRSGFAAESSNTGASNCGDCAVGGYLPHPVGSPDRQSRDSPSRIHRHTSGRIDLGLQQPVPPSPEKLLFPFPATVLMTPSGVTFKISKFPVVRPEPEPTEPSREIEGAAVVDRHAPSGPLIRTRRGHCAVVGELKSSRATGYRGDGPVGDLADADSAKVRDIEGAGAVQGHVGGQKQGRAGCGGQSRQPLPGIQSRQTC